MTRLAAAAGAALLLTPVLAACGSAEEDDAGDAAHRFEQGLSGSPAAACALLAPQTRETLEKDSGKPCAQSLPAEGLDAATSISDVHVAGHSAQVRAGKDTLFLALFDDGWKVTAAGCEQQGTDPEIPYDCQVKGD